jgi:L-seryl-tRNA(Ser) seleniumtransferase
MGGAVLREVGTTNRTRAADYEAAVGPQTGLLLKAHRSNFAIVGFTESPTTAELVAVGRRHGVPVVEDVGSGSLVDLRPYGIAEPVQVTAPLAAGVDLVCFSGDKLLGGPQCGVILGRADLVERLRKHPLTRALRVDKLTIAALEATVRTYVDGSWRRELPAVAALTATADELQARAARLAKALEGTPGLEVQVADGTSAVGGGSLPLTELPTKLVVLRPQRGGEAALEAALRAGDPPVVARVADGRVLLDVRTVRDDEVALLAERVRSAAGRPEAACEAP